LFYRQLGREFGEEKSMTTMHDAILEVVHGNATSDEKIRIITTLISDEDRWTTLYIIWGLIAVVVLTIIAIVCFLFLVNKYALKINDFPQGIIAFGATALGALAAYLVPPSRQQAAPALTAATASALPAPAAPALPAKEAPAALAPGVPAPGVPAPTT
jgi:hypothetical protein